MFGIILLARSLDRANTGRLDATPSALYQTAGSNSSSPCIRAAGTCTNVEHTSCLAAGGRGVHAGVSANKDRHQRAPAAATASYCTAVSRAPAWTYGYSYRPVARPGFSTRGEGDKAGLVGWLE